MIIINLNYRVDNPEFIAINSTAFHSNDHPRTTEAGDHFRDLRS